MRRMRTWMAVMGLLFLASHRNSFAVNEHGDPNCAVVDVMQGNRLVDVDPGDQFWLTVPVGSGLPGVEVHREGDRGWTWLKAGEFLLVQYDQPGEYTIRFRAARALVVVPLTVRVFAPPAELAQPHGHNGQAGAGGVQPLAASSGPSFSVGSVYAGDYVVGTNTVGKYPVQVVAFGIGDCILTKYRDTNTWWKWTFTADDFGTNSTAAKGGVIDGPPAGTNTWTLVKSCGGTHTLSPNSPSRLKVKDLILTNDLGRAPAPGTVTNLLWYALTNETVALRVMPGPYWVTNNPAAAASLFLWTTNNTALPATTNLTQSFSPAPGTNVVNAGCLSPAPATPTNQMTTLVAPTASFLCKPGMINYGFDPTGTDVWTSVGVGSTNEIVQLSLSNVAPGEVELVVTTGADKISVTPTNFTAATTDLRMVGLGATVEAVVQARLKNNPQLVLARIHVMALTPRVLTVGIYRIEDTNSPATSPVGAPTAAQLVATLNELYRPAQVSFTNIESFTTNICYDANTNGTMELAERDALQIASPAWQGNVRLLLIKKSGIYYDAPDYATNWLIRAQSSENAKGAVLFTEDLGECVSPVAAHEIGHLLLLPVFTNGTNGHDSGPWPEGEESLMRSGIEPSGPIDCPGRWLRQEDWRKCNETASTF